MTYKEKFILAYPDIDISKIIHMHCPHDYWLLANCHPDCGGGATPDTCEACWIREEDYI
jgi:hypothetical protein